VVAPNVGVMPLMIGDDTVESRETGASGRTRPPETHTGAGEAPESDACGCDDCQSTSRDEMWSRWA
jgi:hypothetical protein